LCLRIKLIVFRPQFCPRSHKSPREEEEEEEEEEERPARKSRHGCGSTIACKIAG